MAKSKRTVSVNQEQLEERFFKDLKISLCLYD